MLAVQSQDVFVPYPEPQDDNLVALLALLRAKHYHFITTTNTTHQQMLRRKPAMANDLRDIFGWSLPFDAARFSEVAALLDEAGCLQKQGEAVRSTIRVSSVKDMLFMHSAYPTVESDCVFFGPDTYRFVAFLRNHLPVRLPHGCVVDIGAGSGAGGIFASTQLGVASVLTDLNPKALRFCRVNARFAGVEAAFVEAKGLEGISEPIALAVANPPFMAGSGDRLYRDGGAMHGAELSIDWALETMKRLVPGGQMLLYTGVAIVDGKNALCEIVQEASMRMGCRMHCEELDPDIFGDELLKPNYAEVERIAAVGMVIVKE